MNVAFSTDDVDFESSQKKVRFTFAARASTVQLPRLEVYAEGPLLPAAKLTGSLYTKELLPLFLTTSRNLFSLKSFMLHGYLATSSRLTFLNDELKIFTKLK